MSVFKCKMCGGTIEFQEGATVGTCDHCGTKQTLPRLDDDRRANLYDRANHFRRNNEFDKAMGIYETILNEDPTDAEAYWSLVLCKYGVEYVEDPATRRRVPTVNRAQYTSVLADEDYKAAVKNADAAQRALYEAEAKAIDEIQKGILEISQKEEPFDVFICYKETDAQGRRTVDSVRATELYHELTKEGFKVFFARITLEDKLGTAYEPYIFAALNSAKVMIVLGTKPEHFNAVWVKNEWSRYLALIRAGAQKTLIPAYQDMDPYDLPEEFSHLQAQDMSKLGFMQDLIRGVKKLTAVDEPKPAVKETVVVSQPAASASAAPLLERAFMFLEDGKWAEADEYCEKVLDLEPKNARAYLGKLMAQLQVRTEVGLKNAAEPFDGSDNAKKAARFDPALAEQLKADNAFIRKRNENARRELIYQSGLKIMNAAKTEHEFKAAAADFGMIKGVKDADTLAKTCLEKAEIARKDAIYASAFSRISSDSIDANNAAIKLFESIIDWKDSRTKIDECNQKIEEIRIAEEKAEEERKRKAEAARLAAEKKKALFKKIAVIGGPILAVFLIVLNAVIIPAQKKNAFIEKYGEEKWIAFNALKAGDTYKFGTYEQDNDQSNGKEEIEWIVLEKDETSLFLISKYALDCKPYNTEWTSVTWETCSLRKWLNNDFLNAAFGTNQPKKIMETTVTADANPSYSTSPGNNTTDKVFLLSIAEVNKYFTFNESSKCAPTDYAVAQGAWTSAGWWWLRSPGNDSSNAAFVNDDGSVDYDGNHVNSDSGGVRPALWINLES